MSSRKGIVTLCVVALILLFLAVLFFLPRKYRSDSHLASTMVLWNDKEAFTFLNVNTIGHSGNALEDKLGKTSAVYLMFIFGNRSMFARPQMIAYHLDASGRLQRFEIPENWAVYGRWNLKDGALQLDPFPGAKQTGYRWDGSKFVAVPPGAEPGDPGSKVTPGDFEEDTDDATSFFAPSSRKAFKEGGWKYKFITGFYEEGKDSLALPLSLGNKHYELTARHVANSGESGEGLYAAIGGISRVELSGDSLSTPGLLWDQPKTRELQKDEYNALLQKYGHPTRRSWRLLYWILLLLLLFGWKLFSWIHFLYAAATVKKRVVDSVATSFSFPTATPAQFPMLDNAALERYTREFESLGFAHLLDFSLVANTRTPIPSFCRLMVNRRHHCFAEASQIFPHGRPALELKCSFQSYLQDGWSLSFSDRKPQAASSLIRRKKSLGVAMVEATPSELLQAFLKMREQICIDLGIIPLTDDTLEAYISHAQRSAMEMKEAVKEKSFTLGLPEYYYRKLSLKMTNPEYVWLGDYPKEAERRKQGYTVGASAK